MSQTAKGGPETAKRAPEAPEGLEWVVSGPEYPRFLMGWALAILRVLEGPAHWVVPGIALQVPTQPAPPRVHPSHYLGVYPYVPGYTDLNA